MQLRVPPKQTRRAGEMPDGETAARVSCGRSAAFKYLKGQTKKGFEEKRRRRRQGRRSGRQGVLRPAAAARRAAHPLSRPARPPRAAGRPIFSSRKLKSVYDVTAGDRKSNLYSDWILAPPYSAAQPSSPAAKLEGVRSEEASARSGAAGASGAALARHAEGGFL